MPITAQGCAEIVSSEPRFLAARLSLLIFAAFTVMGAWVPNFSLHLENLGFSADETAWASSTNALGAMIAPLIWGQIADRWLATERCISLCALVTGVLLWWLALLTEPAAVIAVSLVLWFFLIPVLSLTGAFIFRQLEHPDRQYGKIRLWGTVGWMAVSWCLTLWFARQEGVATDFADSLRLGSLAAFLVAVYALTLPHAPPSSARSHGLERSRFARLVDAPLIALALLRGRAFFVYCACMFGLYITMPFTIQLNPLFLKKLGVDAKLLPVYLTMAQTTEVLALILLPTLLLRWGAKATMVLGGASCALGFIMLGSTDSIPWVLAAFATQGIFICCFVISGQVFVNRQTPGDIRASAQGVLIFVNGSGLFLGHLLVGWLRGWTEDRYEIAYRVAAVVATGLVLLFLAGFSVPHAAPDSGQDSFVPDSDMP